MTVRNTYVHFLVIFIIAVMCGHSYGQDSKSLTIQKDPSDHSAYFDLAHILALRGKSTEAVKMLESAVKYGAYKRKDLEEEDAFISLKETAAFKAILESIKGRK